MIPAFRWSKVWNKSSGWGMETTGTGGDQQFVGRVCLGRSRTLLPVTTTLHLQWIYIYIYIYIYDEEFVLADHGHYFRWRPLYIYNEWSKRCRADQKAQQYLTLMSWDWEQVLETQKYQIPWSWSYDGQHWFHVNWENFQEGFGQGGSRSEYEICLGQVDDDDPTYNLAILRPLSFSLWKYTG